MLTLEALEILQEGFRLEADFRVAEGSITAVIGPSGAGKSTLLSVIAGFFPAARGRVLWKGKDISGLDPGARPLSIVFQDNNLFPHLTAYENVALGLNPTLRLAEEERQKATAALAKVGLGGLESRKPGALSGGQQSRVALARVLVRGKPLLLLDEPFSALGPALRAEMLDLVRSVAAETRATVLMVSHEPSDARRVADRVVLVSEGRAHAPMETAVLFADPPDALRAYLGDAVTR